MSEPLNRRQFLGATAAGSTLLAAQTAPAAEGDSWPAQTPVKIYKVYIGRTGDFMARPAEEMTRLNQHLAELEKKLGDVKFVGGDTIPHTPVEEVLRKTAGADALLVIYLSGHGGDAPVLSKLFDTGLPAALFFQPFGGHGWMYFQQWRKEARKVVILSTSDWSELDRTVGLLRSCPHEANPYPRRRPSPGHGRFLLRRTGQEKTGRGAGHGAQPAHPGHHENH